MNIFEALVICISMGIIFVVTLYLLPQNIRKKPRDDPIHIRYRFMAVTCSSLFCVLVFCTAFQGRRVWESLGLRSEGMIPALVLPLASVAALFLGPLMTLATSAYLHAQTLRKNNPKRAFVSTFMAALLGEMVGPYRRGCNEVVLRALVVGPISEELVFRSCMLPLLLCAGLGKSKIIAFGPLLFGVAHVHHFLHNRHLVGWSLAAQEALLQLSYTYVFGVISATIFVRTGHLAPCILVHTFCNWMGLPDISFVNERHSLHLYCRLLTASYFLGIGMFGFSFLPLTAPWIYGSWEWECS